MEHDDLVNAVQELGAEVLLQLVGNLRLHLFIAGGLVPGPREAEVDALADVAGTEVGGHHDDGVLEVHHTALCVREATLIEDLQQRVEDVRVGLLDFVEQHHRERLATYLLGELAALLVADVAGRGPEHPGRGVLLGVFAHVEGDERILVAEQELCECLGELGLPNT